jgi:tetraprenyl-beta-curcumene synthase
MMVRYWLVAYPLLRAELRSWEHRAADIPDPQLRADALLTLRRERLNAAGAALFAVVSLEPDPQLVQMLIAFQLIWDYLDTLAERPAEDALANAAQLHHALTDALLPAGGPAVDYYALHPVHDDGGYLAALIAACRIGSGALPSFDRVRDIAVQEAARARAVQSVNHAPASERARALRTWATTNGARADASWFELAAAASSSLAIHALLAAAADAGTTTTTAERVRAAYLPWICTLSTLLDSLVDEHEDAVNGTMSFIGEYGDRSEAVARLQAIAARSLEGARGLPRGERHAVIVAGTIAMYLSHDSAWTPGARAVTIGVLRASGALTLPLLVLLRAWRTLLTLRQRAPVFNSE